MRSQTQVQADWAVVGITLLIGMWVSGHDGLAWLLIWMNVAYNLASIKFVFMTREYRDGRR